MSQPPLAWGVGTKQLGMGRVKELLYNDSFALHRSPCSSKVIYFFSTDIFHEKLEDYLTENSRNLNGFHVAMREEVFIALYPFLMVTFLSTREMSVSMF